MNKKIATLLFLTNLFGSLNIYSACCGDVQRGEGAYKCPDYCNWQRLDSRCNDDSECCPGSYCSAFGYCEACR